MSTEGKLIAYLHPLEELGLRLLEFNPYHGKGGRFATAKAGKTSGTGVSALTKKYSQGDASGMHKISASAQRGARDVNPESPFTKAGDAAHALGVKAANKGDYNASVGHFETSISHYTKAQHAARAGAGMFANSPAGELGRARAYKQTGVKGQLTGPRTKTHEYRTGLGTPKPQYSRGPHRSGLGIAQPKPTPLGTRTGTAISAVVRGAVGQRANNPQAAIAPPRAPVDAFDRARRNIILDRRGKATKLPTSSSRQRAGASPRKGSFAQQLGRVIKK